MYLKSLVYQHFTPQHVFINYNSLTNQNDDLKGIFAIVKKKNKRIILKNLEITAYAAEGRALAKMDGKVIFVSGAVPGDNADVLLTKNKKDWAEGRVITITAFSAERADPFCRHFGTCGGCKWQMLPYEKQLEFKQQEVVQNLQRISKAVLPPVMPIIGADDTSPVTFQTSIIHTY